MDNFFDVTDCVNFNKKQLFFSLDRGIFFRLNVKHHYIMDNLSRLECKRLDSPHESRIKGIALKVIKHCRVEFSTLG